MRARALIGALTEDGGVAPGCPTAIILAKTDLVSEDAALWFDGEATKLQEWCRERELEAIVIHVAARPESSPDEPKHLEGILNFLANEPSAEPNRELAALADDRSYWRFGLG